MVGRLVAVVAVVALLPLTACSQLFGDSLSSACSAARQEFNDYLDLQNEANNAYYDADSHWIDIYNAAINGELSDEALALGAAALNDDLDRFSRKAARAAEVRARYEAARAACDRSSMPKACRREFRQYTQLTDNFDQVLLAMQANTDAVTAQRDALTRDDVDAANAATTRHEAAGSQLDALVDEYNDTLLPAYNRALDACDAAL